MEEAPWHDAWQAILEWLTPLVSPSWNDLIPLLPLALVALVVAVVAFLAWRWMATADKNRPRLARRRAVAAPPPGIHLPGPSLWPFVVPVGAALVLFALVLRPRDGSGAPVGAVNVPLLVAGLLISGVAVAGWLRDAMGEWRRTAAGAHAEVGAHRTAVEAGAHRAAAEAAAASHAIAGGPPAAGHAPLLPATVGPLPDARPIPVGIHLPGPSPWPFLAPIGMAFFFLGLVFSPAVAVGGILMSIIAAAGWLRDAGHEYHAVASGGHASAPSRPFPTALVGVYGLIAALSLAVQVAPGIIAFANASPGASASASAGPVSDRVQLVAKGNQFDQSEITVPADKNVTIVLDNQDSVPHNVAIYDSPQRTKELFQGELQQTPGQITYQVPAQPAGTYYFVCVVHPTMAGTYTAR